VGVIASDTGFGSPEARLELKLEGNAEQFRVRVAGEIVAATCGELRQAVLEAGDRRPARLVVDLEGVTFVDTSGIGVLIGLRSHLKGKGVVLAIENATPRVHGVFKSMRLLQVFGLPED